MSKPFHTVFILISTRSFQGGSLLWLHKRITWGVGLFCLFVLNPDALLRLQDNYVRILGMEGVQDPVNSNVTTGKNKDFGSYPHFAKTWEKGNQLGPGFTACGGDIQNQVLHLLSNPSLPVFFLLWLLRRREKNSY